MSRRAVVLSTVMVACAVGNSVFTQIPTPAASPGGPTFDVVSIRKIPEGAFSTAPRRITPDGGMSLNAVTARALISRAYPTVDGEIAGLPAWAGRQQYDVVATASLKVPTADDRAAMVRAMLADRFKLLAHIEKREVAAYDLLLARSDGRLGPGMAPIAADCAAKLAADRAAAQAALDAGTFPAARPPDFNAPPPPCVLRIVGDGKSDRLEGETPISGLVAVLRTSAGRFVADKTGLTGSYRLLMHYSRVVSLRGPGVAVDLDTAPDVFTAVREQLGLRLESSKAERDVLVIDRIEPPTEN